MKHPLYTLLLVESQVLEVIQTEILMMLQFNQMVQTCSESTLD